MCFTSGGGPPELAPISSDAADDESADASNDASADAAPAACGHGAGAVTCEQIPIACLPKPTCACIVAYTSPACVCSTDPSESGFVVQCVY